MINPTQQKLFNEIARWYRQERAARNKRGPFRHAHVVQQQNPGNRCYRFRISTAPTRDDCGLLQVQARKTKWNRDTCSWDPDNNTTFIKLPAYGLLPPQAIIDEEEYGIRPGDVIWAEYSKEYECYIVKHCIFTDNRLIVEALECDITKEVDGNTFVDPDKVVVLEYQFSAGHLCRIIECQDPTDAPCCYEETIPPTQPNCVIDPGGPMMEGFVCLEAFTWDEVTGEFEVTVKVGGAMCNPDNFSNHTPSLLICIGGGCSYDVKEITNLQYSPTEGAIEGLTNNNDVFVSYLTHLWGPPGQIPECTLLTISGNTVWNELTNPDLYDPPCCDFNFAVLYVPDSTAGVTCGAGPVVAEVGYSSIPCGNCIYDCSISPPERADQYSFDLICIGDGVKLTIDGSPGAVDTNVDVLFVTVTVDGQPYFSDWCPLLCVFDIDISMPEQVEAMVTIHRNGIGGPPIADTDATITCNKIG